MVHDLYLSMRAKATAPKSKKMKNEPLPPIPYEPYSVVFELKDPETLLEVASVLSCKLGGKFNVVPVHPEEANHHTAKLVLFTLPQKRINICPDDADKPLVFQSVARFCMKIMIRGIPEVGGAYVDEAGVSFNTNLVLPLASLSLINPLTCTSNDVHAVLHALGVEAALVTLYTEMQKVIQFDGNRIHWKYVYLLAESIMHRGYMCPITRHGMGRKQNGVLIRASFETTKEVFLEGGTHALNDPMHGITPNIMFANRIPCGTGTFDVLPLPGCKRKRYEPNGPSRPATSTASVRWDFFANVHDTIARLHTAATRQSAEAAPSPRVDVLRPSKLSMCWADEEDAPLGSPSPAYKAESDGYSPEYDPDHDFAERPKLCPTDDSRTSPTGELSHPPPQVSPTPPDVSPTLSPDKPPEVSPMVSPMTSPRVSPMVPPMVSPMASPVVSSGVTTLNTASPANTGPIKRKNSDFDDIDALKKKSKLQSMPYPPSIEF